MGEGESTAAAAVVVEVGLARRVGGKEGVSEAAGDPEKLATGLEPAERLGLSEPVMAALFEAIVVTDGEIGGDADTLLLTLDERLAARDREAAVEGLIDSDNVGEADEDVEEDEAIETVAAGLEPAERLRLRVPAREELSEGVDAVVDETDGDAVGAVEVVGESEMEADSAVLLEADTVMVGVVEVLAAGELDRLMLGKTVPVMVRVPDGDDAGVSVPAMLPLTVEDPEGEMGDGLPVKVTDGETGDTLADMEPEADTVLAGEALMLLDAVSDLLIGEMVGERLMGEAVFEGVGNFELLRVADVDGLGMV